MINKETVYVLIEHFESRSRPIAIAVFPSYKQAETMGDFMFSIGKIHSFSIDEVQYYRGKTLEPEELQNDPEIGAALDVIFPGSVPAHA